MGKEIAAGDHHGIVAAAEVSLIFEFFGENVAGINHTMNVHDAEILQ